MPKLTASLIKTIEPSKKAILLHDNEIKGFQCKITPTGKQVFLYYYRTHDFRQRRPVIGVHGNITCEQARIIAKQWQAQVALGGDPSLAKTERREMVTVKMLSEKYMKEHAALKKKPDSAKNDEYVWQSHILPRIGSYKVSSIERSDIAKIHAALSATPTSANRCIALLSKAFNLAEIWGYRKDNTNPCRHIQKYKEKKRRRYLSVEEIARLSQVLDQCEADKSIMASAANALRLLMLTGSRLSEILELKWCYVDLDNQIINLPDSKTGAKSIYLPADAVAILDKLFENPNRCKTNPYVITGREPNSHLINIAKPWYRVRKLAGLDDVRIHDLRHTFASIAVASGLSLPVIGGLLGHTQTSTTARYAHLCGAVLKDAVSQVGNLVFKAMDAKTD